MYVKRMQQCKPFIANDGCEVRELLHPTNDPTNLPYSVALCRVAVGGSTVNHFLRQSETYLIIEGSGRAYIGGDIVELTRGDAVVIPPEVPQRIENLGTTDLQFAAIVSPPWRSEDDIRL